MRAAVGRAQQHGAARVEHGEDRAVGGVGEELRAQRDEVQRQCQQADRPARRVGDRLRQHRHPAPALGGQHERIAGAKAAGAQRAFEPRQPLGRQRGQRIGAVGADEFTARTAHAERGEFDIDLRVLAEHRVAGGRVHRLDARPRGELREHGARARQRALHVGGGVRGQAVDLRRGGRARLALFTGEQPRGHAGGRRQQRQHRHHDPRTDRARFEQPLHLPPSNPPPGILGCGGGSHAAGD